MAELSAVFGNNGDTGLNNAHSNNQLSNSYGNMKNDNNQYNTNANIYPNQQQQSQEQEGNQETDAAIEKIQNHINKQKKINELKNELKKSKDNDSIIDRYIKRKKDMAKLFTLVLLMLLALSMNDVIKTYLGKYILGNDITNRNEMYLRLAVPLTIYFLIWTMKAFSK